MSRRTERVARLIRNILADAIQNRLNDPRIEWLTSITRVEVSEDLSVAHVYVSVMADEPRRRRSVQALQHAAGRLRTLVARDAPLRQVPALDFRLDDSVRRSFETVTRLDHLMHELDGRPLPGAEERTVAAEQADNAQPAHRPDAAPDAERDVPQSGSPRRPEP